MLLFPIPIPHKVIGGLELGLLASVALAGRVFS